MSEISEQVVQIFANFLSTLTILSCLFLKVPQIMHICKRKSAEGIHIQAMLLEITGFSITTLYNYTNGYNIMTYLEYPIILLQIYVMLYFTLKYKGLLNSPVVPLATAFYVTNVIAFALNILQKDILSFFLPFCTPLSGFAKVSYVYGIVSAGNADAVSLTTWIISILTNMSRLFTVYVDSADIKLLFNFSVSSMLSFVVLITAIYYQALTKSAKSQKVTKKE